MNKLLLISVIVYPLFFVPEQLQAQENSTEYGEPVKAYYSSVITKNADLYSGREYQPHPMRFQEGHPFFIHPGWIEGELKYNGKNFENVSLKYDLTRDELVLMHFNGYFMIQLNKTWVDEFILDGHRFGHYGDNKKLTGALEEGYYEILYDGAGLLLKKRGKKINAVGNGMNQGYEVTESSSIFLIRNGNLATIKGKKSFLKQLPGTVSLSKYVNSIRPSFRKDPENFMIRVLEFLGKDTR